MQFDMTSESQFHFDLKSRTSILTCFVKIPIYITIILDYYLKFIFSSISFSSLFFFISHHIFIYHINHNQKNLSN